MIEDTLRKFAEEVADEFPLLRQILDEAKSGKLDEDQALKALSEMLVANPEVGRLFQQKALAAFTSLVDEEQAEPLDHDGLVMHPTKGLPKLNPLVEAALIERAQFDEDMPELRSGPMPQGVTPAVSVETDVRNPVAMGQMLEAAAANVLKDINEADAGRKKLVQAAVESMEGDDEGLLALMGRAETALQTREMADLLLAGKSDLVDAPTYKRGQVATTIVEKPSGSALLALTPEQRRQSAWKFLSTTQGRRSAVKGITELVTVKLQSEGFDVTVRAFHPQPGGSILAAHEWSVRIDGAGSTQSSFNLMDIAAAGISKGLTEKSGERRGSVYLELVPVNTVDVRLVGWAGRLVVEDSPALPSK